MTCLWSSTASSLGRTLDFQSNGLEFEPLVGKETPFSQNWKPENIKTLSWPMRSGKNHSEPQNYRSLKNLGKRSFKINQQETKWHASDRAPLAQSGERWTFNPKVSSSSPLWGKRHSFHKTRSRKKEKLPVDQCNPERITKSRKSIGLQKTCETIQTNSTKQCDMRLFEPGQFSREKLGLSIQRLGFRVPCRERDNVFTKLEAGKYKNFELTNATRKNHEEL